MSTTIHFSSGKTQEVSTGRLDKFIMELKSRGIKLMLDRNEERVLLIPLNSNTIEFVIDTIEAPKEKPEPVAPVMTETQELKAILQDAEKAKAEVESKKDIEEKRDDAMAELMAKSACTHENTRIFRHDTTKGSRYFPVCTFCGKRERYVKADSLSEETRENATLWED